MKRNILISWAFFMMMALVCVGFTACGGSDDDDEGGGSSSGSNSGSVSIPVGIYYCQEANTTHKNVKSLVASGMISNAREIIRLNNGGCGTEDAAIKVKNGNVFTWTLIYCSLKSPKGSDWGGGTPIIVDKQSYGEFSAYYFVWEEAGPNDRWEDALKSGFTYNSNTLTYQGKTFKRVY